MHWLQSWQNPDNQSWQPILTTNLDDQPWLRYAQDMPKICPRYTRDLPKICSKYAWDMPKICPRYAQDMPKIPSMITNLDYQTWLTILTTNLDYQSWLPTLTTNCAVESRQSEAISDNSWQNPTTLLSEWVSHSPTWIQEMVAHLKINTIKSKNEYSHSTAFTSLIR